MKFLKNVVRGAWLAAFLFAGAPLFGTGSPLGVPVAHADVVSSIVVQGNTRVDAETVRSYVVIVPGRNFGAGEVDQSVKALYATGLFSDVRIGRSGNALVVTVAENAIIAEVTFQGNKKIKTDMLRNIVETKARSMYSDVKVKTDVERLKAYYQQSGRAGATVTSEVKQLGDKRVEVVFNIVEGDRTGISTINFEGNNAYSDRRLRAVLQTKQTNWLSWLTKRDIYDQARLEADQEALRRFYLKNGYADFRVISATADFNDAAGRYTINIVVDEGPRYRYGNIRVDSSIPEVSGDQLLGFVKTRTGRTFDSTELEKSQEDLTIELSRRGYAFAQVRPRGDRNYEAKTIDLTYLIDEGPRVYIERIEIAGNSKTRDFVIRREFDISEGDAYNRVLIDKVERRLRNLGLFKTVAITTTPGSGPDRVILHVNVEEDSSGEFSVAGGYSTTAGFIAELSMTERNFLGRGQYLKLSFGYGQRGNKTYTLSFTDPYFMGRRVSFGVDAYITQRGAQFNRPYSSQIIGGGIRFGFPITDNFTIETNYKIISEQISGAPTNFNGLGVNVQTVFPDGTYITSSVGYAAIFSTLDSRRDPHSGVYLRLSQDFAGAGGDRRYMKSQLDARYFREVIPQSDIIGMVRVGGGNITGIGQPVAAADNFAYGGDLVRGFANYGIGPRGNVTGIGYGGKNFAVATAEVQFPMPMIPDDFGLRGAFFADAGSLWGIDLPTGFTACPTGAGAGAECINGGSGSPKLRASVGASILWASPFGLLRADFGFALKKEPYDQPQVFRFSAGTTF